MKPERPFIAILLSFMWLVFGILYLARLWQALTQWVFLKDLLPFSPAYLAVSGVLWGAIGLYLALILWLGVGRAPRLTRLSLIAYSAYYWLEYNLLVEHKGLTSNWPFLAVINLALGLWVYWVLSRSTTRIYFGENNE